MKLQRVGLLLKGGKRFAYWCTLFLSYTFFYLSKSYFTLSLFSFLSFSTLYSDCLSSYLPSSYGYCSYLYTKSRLCDFSLLRSLLTNHFVHCKHSSKVPTTLLAIWILPPLLLSMYNIFFLFHYLSHDKLSSILFCRAPLSPIWMVKPWVSFY